MRLEREIGEVGYMGYIIDLTVKEGLCVWYGVEEVDMLVSTREQVYFSLQWSS